MARWLSLRLARALGVAANIRFPLPGGFLWDTFRSVLPHVPESDPLERRVTVWHLRAILDGLDDAPRFEPLRAYLRAADECGSYELAARIADLFDQYLVYRPQWIARWEAGADEGWQAALWRALVARTAEPHRARVQDAALSALAKPPAAGTLPRRVAVFGIPTLAPAYLHGFRRLAEHVDVHLFLLAPCREYWGDVARPRRTRAGGVEGGAPETPGAALLASLGKQGRDFLDLVIDCDPHVDEPAFREPGDDSLLHALQTDMLTLRAGDGRIAIAPDDRSIQVHVCHGPMREVEVLYDQLLWLFEQHPDLTPADVVVMTPDIDAYAPAIEAVFGGAAGPRRIPFTIADRSLRADSPLVEAFLGLLDLPDSRYDADRLLTLLEAPAVHRRFGIASGDMDLVQRLVTESAVRWGVDAASRPSRFAGGRGAHLALWSRPPAARLQRPERRCATAGGRLAVRRRGGKRRPGARASRRLRRGGGVAPGVARGAARARRLGRVAGGVLDRFIDAAEDDVETCGRYAACSSASPTTPAGRATMRRVAGARPRAAASRARAADQRDAS